MAAGRSVMRSILGWLAAPDENREDAGVASAFAESGPLGRRHSPLSGTLDPDSDIYGIRALESCRARQ